MTLIAGLHSSTAEGESFAPHQVIFTEGQLDAMTYVVLSGEVDIYCGARLKSTLGPGEVLGEMPHCGAGACRATAVARTRCTLLPINERRFNTLVQQTPSVALHMMRVLVDRLSVRSAS